MTELLQNRTWEDLRATARAHRWTFDNNFRKDEARAALRRALLEEGRLKRALHHLAPEECEALMALKAQGGSILKRKFRQAYGEICKYRPWRADYPRHPWRRPVSLAEKLWFLGLIEVQAHQAILLPDAVSEVAPRPPSRKRRVEPPPSLPIVMGEVSRSDGGGNLAGGFNPLSNAALVRDLAALLGTLLHNPVRPLHGRWLPLYTLRAINQRLAQPENLLEVRSELQCQRTRWLHYLAQVAGLVKLHEGRLLPTPEAWEWLTLPYQAALEALLQAVLADLRERYSLWERFRLPEIRAEVLDYLLALPPRAYPLAALALALRLQTLAPEMEQEIQAALRGPLCWSGLGRIAGQRVDLLPRPAIETQTVTLHPAPDSLGITLPLHPPLRPFVDLLAVASLDERGLRLVLDSMGRAVELGLETDQLAQSLAELTGKPLEASVIEQLQAWTRAATRVSIKPMTVLETSTPEDMQRIRADWRLRPFLGKQLSAHHVEVRDEQQLRLRLARRGYPLPRLKDPKSDPLPRKNNDDPAYLWVAMRVCQALGKRIPLPVKFPGAAIQHFEAELGERKAALQGLVDRCVEQIEYKLKGQLQGAPLVEQLDPERLRCMVTQAAMHGGSLRIRYYSPSAGYETERTIEPQVVYERDRATYIEAWCYRDDAQRTFRLDRILAVL